MNLKSGYPYFFLKNGLYHDFDVLRENITTDVVVLGGGISGALMAYELVKQGIECCVIDKRKIGLGSTGASTCLLQYEIDVPLHQLITKIGKGNAIEAYRLCSEAIDKIYKIAGEIGYKDFSYCESLYFSHTSRKNTYLQREFESRHEAGFKVKYLLEKEIQERYKLRSKEAILSEKAARIDAYLFTHLLHLHNQKKECRVYEATHVTKITETGEGVELITDTDLKINTKKIIYATGYEVTEQISKSIVDLKSTFALVTERIENLPDCFGKSLFWNTDDPYLYVREDKGRLIIGGRDEKHYNPAKREILLERKAKKLKGDFEKIFPDIKIKTQFTWAGTFGSTKDGLPYIGPYAKNPNSYFALGFGGNGITFSALAADLISGLIKDKVNTIPPMFSFNR
ncbi:FAD-dependent oxidoreductase [Sphingobacteriaceae bacterium]|nr:FAD-dependent oxidoreductase [Sphingobacteriaceae bacterium]